MDTKPCVLIVDDDTMIRETLSDLLAAEGYAVVCADSGVAALDSMKEQVPEVALLDFKLSDMNGIELLEEIKNRALPTECIVITGYATKELAISAIGKGAYDIIEKPYSHDLLFSSVRRAVEKIIAERALCESERLLKEAQSIAHMGHWELDLKIGTPRWSDEIFHIFGLDPKASEPSFTDHETHVISDDWPILNDAVTRASKDGTSFDISFRIVKPNNEIRWMHSIGTSQKDENGKVIRLFGTAQDITDRKKAEEELADRELKYRTIFETSPEGIGLLDTDGILIDANDRFKDWMEYDPDEAIGKRFFDLPFLAGENKVMVEAAFKRRLSGEDVPPYEITLFSKSGRKLVLLIHAKAMTDEHGDISKVLVMVTNITEGKKADEDLKKAEQKYKALYESSRDAIMVLEPPTWNFTAGNEATVKMFGAKGEKEFISKRPPDLSPERQPDGQSSMDKAMKMINLAMETGSNFFEWTHKKITGEEFPATVLLTRMELDGREVLQATVRDITARKKAEESILRFSKEWSDTFDAVTEGITIHSVDYEIMNVNAAVCRMLGKSKEELIGKKCYQVFHGTDEPVDVCPMEKSIRSHKAEEAEAYEPTIGRWLAVGTAPIKDKAGGLIGYVHTIRDITERKEMEELKEGLIIDVTHELKSPIALMEMAYDMGDRALETKDYKRVEDAQRIGRVNLGRLREDVINILDMFSVGVKRETSQCILLQELVESIVKDLNPLIEGTGVEVSVDIPEDAGFVEMPEQEASCMIRNIVGNAVKFTKKGTIDISSRMKGDWIEVSVKDTGCGIKKEDIGRVFDRFFKGSSPMPGTGLGLALCKKVVALNRGSITVASDGEGKGTTVIVRLPATAESAEKSRGR